MKIEKITGKRKEEWIVYHQGYCYYETYGPSMTDWASMYKIDRLLSIKGAERRRVFENDLPSEFGGLPGLMRILIKEIETEKDINNHEVIVSISKIPLIKKFIINLENQEE